MIRRERQSGNHALIEHSTAMDENLSLEDLGAMVFVQASPCGSLIHHDQLVIRFKVTPKKAKALLTRLDALGLVEAVGP